MELINIPYKLKGWPQWVCWRYEWRGGGQTKVPYNPRIFQKASVNNSRDWVTFAEASDRYLKNSVGENAWDGLGFVFTKNDPFCGIDLDNAGVPDSLGIMQWTNFALGAVNRFDSYTEITPSGYGLHIIVEGSLPGSRCRSGDVELYDRNRFFTVTGDILGSASRHINYRQAGLDTFYAELFPPESDNSSKETPPSMDLATCLSTDDDILEQIERSSNRENFIRLWEGRWKEMYPSQSEADLALCGLLAFWFKGDMDRVDRVFRRSKLYRPKWERPSYRNRTLTLAGK